LAVVVAVTAVWLALDRRPPEWDHANHLERAVRCAGDLARRDLPAILERSSFYPPLVLCAAGLAYRLAPSDVAAAQSVVLAFLGLGTGAVYVLARRFAGATEGVGAARVFAPAPFVVFSSLPFQLGLPWYGPRLLGLAPEIASRSFRQAAESGHPEPLTAAALMLYPRWFPMQLGLVAALLFVLGLGVAARRRHWLLLASVLPAFAL